ncbi:Fimbrial assembly family protein [Thermodesulfobium narugense DSM 14796]|uniref:Fimbrial assembly family protein n=1 Tax=Thermodesulfobium narugense DSM 14796 TaxID=747365 RepID=M1E6J6_9BACT|nr:PilN domain-containing protein [Thermodesulfobium narugense]AEE14208.1 Fimbrial assembly family protein [Thermodesulfobium narugense DSM 14796]
MKNSVYMRYVVNLLPEEFTEKTKEVNQNLVFIVPVAVFFILLLLTGVAFALNFYMSSKINSLNAQITALMPDALNYDVLLKRKNELQEANKVLQGIDQRSKIDIEVLEDLRSSIPADTWITSLKINGSHYTLNGSSLSSTSPAYFYYLISKSKILSNPRLDEIIRVSGKGKEDSNNAFNFIFDFEVSR